MVYIVQYHAGSIDEGADSSIHGVFTSFDDAAKHVQTTQSIAPLWVEGDGVWSTDVHRDGERYPDSYDSWSISRWEVS